ncbi:MAG: DNA primase DnaG [Nanoarchaeota archaeon]|nr:DNA primase DnaG [Nanoarchaeota archaeon]
MAKISPVSIKYMVHAKFEAVGPVEKPDVIGALFGQTEGLLGRDLELRELQKEGKIGRIEVTTESAQGKTKGTIQIPTALDQSETSLIAAAIETIDRVGPTEAEIKVENIEDVRGNKRDYILERAKKLLEGIEGSQSSKEIASNLKISTRASRIKEYGDEKLPCGDLDDDEIIVVEGRADVVNLLKNKIDNVIGMNGTKLPKGVIELSKDKKIVLFADGDRGGKLIAKNVIENAEVDYIAFAPDGKEVEELSGKEILASLRKRIPAKEFSSHSLSNSKTEISKIDKNKLKEILKEVEGSKKAYIFDEKLNILKKVSVSGCASIIEKTSGAKIVAVDGKAISVVVKACESVGVDVLAARNFVKESSKGIEFLSF